MATGTGDLGGHHAGDGGADPAVQVEDLHVGNVPRKDRGPQPVNPSVIDQPMAVNPDGLVEVRDAGRGDASHIVVDARRR